jgi:nicotinamide-nucleotide amidase
VIRRRRINCLGGGESQIESMLPDLIRRGRRPTVGINASKATIILRIAADGQSEQECYAAMEPTVATIRQCLGTLVFGEEDDELQHAVVRLLRQRRQTLATVEWGAAGLVTQWLGGVDGGQDVYRGGLVAADETALRTVAWACDAVSCDARTTAFGPVEAAARCCRMQFGADFGLAIEHQIPATGGVDGGDGGGPPLAIFALASADGVRQKSIPRGIHPALLHLYIAKHALNFVRLALIGQ